MDIKNNYGNQVCGNAKCNINNGLKVHGNVNANVINRTPWVEQTIICGDDHEVVEPEREPKLWEVIVAGIVVVLFSPFILLVYLAMNPDKLLAVLVVVGIFLAIYYKNFI